MPEVSRDALQSLIEILMSRGGDVDSVTDLFITAANNADAIPEEARPGAKLFLDTFTKKEQLDLRRDIAAGNVEVVRAKIRGKVDEIAARGNVQRALQEVTGEQRLAEITEKGNIQRSLQEVTGEQRLAEQRLRGEQATERELARGVSQEAAIEARSKAATEQALAAEITRQAEAEQRARLAGTTTRERGLAQLDVEAERIAREEARLAASPTVTALREQIDKIENMLSGRKSVPVESVRRSIELIGQSELPHAKAAQIQLTNKLDTLILEQTQKTENALNKLGVRDPAARQIALESVGTTARKASPAILEQARTAEAVKGEALSAASKAGLILEGELTEPRARGFLASLPLIGGGGRREAGELFGQIEKLRTSDPSRARALIPQAVETARKGPLRRLGAAGGIAALLLGLPALLRSGKQEPAMNPLLQVQLLQALTQAQQQGALTNATVGARNAAAERDSARAMLLRLQALQSAGGAVPSVV